MVELDLNNKENEEEPNFSDPEDFIDDINDRELVPDVLHQQPKIDEYDECCVVIFGLPIVGAERFGKLQAVLSKIFTNIDPDHNVFFPKAEDGGSKGCAFIELPEKTKAEHAKMVLDGYKLDKNHTFSALLYKEFSKFKKPEENWVPPQPQPYNDVGDLWWWMQNSRCRDQFGVQFEKNGIPTVAVYTHIKGHEPELSGDQGLAERSNWTETDTNFRWSPHGTYLATIHPKGIALWGGPKFSRCGRFAHDDVQYIDFSPCEKYLVTYAQSKSHNQFAEDDESLRIWNVTTGEMCKSFSLVALTNRGHLQYWPFFQWSHDEKYFACLKAPEKDKLEKEKKINGISVYESEKWGLVEKHHVIIENIKNFSWSPSQNVLAYYSECSDNAPAEFGMMQMPGQLKMRCARIYNVAEARMFWQKSGKRLAVYTMRYNKKQIKETGEVKYIGGCTSHIEIFEIDKKDVSLMNLPLPEDFVNFGWEPHGDKFCVLTGAQSTKVTPHVYRIEANGHAPKLMSKLDPGVQFNEVSFAPAGGWLAVLALKSSGGNVLFIDTTLAEAKRSNVVEHPGFNEGYWDPTGRYFVTCATAGGRNGADLGYRLYTFQGRELFRKNLERMTQFVWRPRPPVRLPEQKLKEIKKTLKKTATRFDREDNEEKYRASQEVVDKRRKIMASFEVVRSRNLRKFEESRDLRIRLRGGVDTDETMTSMDDWVEETITVVHSTQKTRAESGEIND